MSICTRIRTFLDVIKKKLTNLNLFERYSSDIHAGRRQRITTRLYLIIFTIVIMILIIYTSLNDKLKRITIKSPTLAHYEQLQMQYPNNLECPCSYISIKYELFIQFEPVYHNICSSDFVGQQWIDYLHDIIPLAQPNFRVLASVQFHFLSLLCQLTDEIVNDSLTQFYATKFINIRLVSRDLFESQIQNTIQVFKTSAPRTFKRTLDMIRGLIQGNALMPVYETNWKFTVINSERGASVYTNPRSYDSSCNCGTSSICSQPAIFNDDLNLTLSGFLIGCYPVESILQSTLECLYQQTCINSIMSLIEDPSLNITFTPLAPILSSANSYPLNETVQQIVDRLFVNDWYVNQSYTNYFDECHPSYCTYSYIEHFDSTYIVTTILGLFGGLSILLKIFLIVIVRFVFFIRNRPERNAVTPADTLESSVV